MELGEALGAVAALQQEGPPAATSASEAFSRRASPAKTSGGKCRSSRSASQSLSSSG